MGNSQARKQSLGANFSRSRSFRNLDQQGTSAVSNSSLQVPQRSKAGRRSSVANLVQIVSNRHDLEREFFEACYDGSMEHVKSLIEADRTLIEAEYNPQRHGNMTQGLPVPLHLAEKSTCLHIAVFCNYEKILELLLETAVKNEKVIFRRQHQTRFRAKALVNKITEPNRWTALHLASFYGRVECLRLLCDMAKLKKSDLNLDCRHNTEDWTAIMLAATEGYADCVDFLASRGASLDSQNAKGMTALHLAAQRGHNRVVQMICHRAGPSSFLFEMKDISGGWTPLMWASYGAHSTCVEYILQKADSLIVNDRDDDGRTALGLAGKEPALKLSFSKEIDRTIKILKQYNATK